MLRSKAVSSYNGRSKGALQIAFPGPHDEYSSPERHAGSGFERSNSGMKGSEDNRKTRQYLLLRLRDVMAGSTLF